MFVLLNKSIRYNEKAELRKPKNIMPLVSLVRMVNSRAVISRKTSFIPDPNFADVRKSFAPIVIA